MRLRARWPRGAALALTAALILLAPKAFAMDEVRLASGRSYLIETPPGVQSPPLILALHGGGGNAHQFERASGLTRAALRAGFAVAYPAGSSRRGPLLTWNAGHCCAYAAQARIDDLAFLDAVIADAASRYRIDRRRVFLTGMSNGSMMALTYAAERPGAVRAVASVAGVLDLRRHPPKGPVPVLHLHGTADDHVPFDGGIGTGAVVRVAYPSVPEMMRAWVRAAGRTLTPQRAVIDPSRDGMQVNVTRWSDGAGRDRVVLMAIEGGGHAWHGDRRAARHGGTRDIDATAEVLQFFQDWR